MIDFKEVEKEVLKELAQARESIRKVRETFPVNIDKQDLIDKTLSVSKFSKHFVDKEAGDKLADELKLILNTATVSSTFDVGYENSYSSYTSNKERAAATAKLDKKLGVIVVELSKKLAEALDGYLNDYPSMKIANKLVITVDDVRCVRDVIMDIQTFDTTLRHNFIMKLNIYVG